MLLKIATLYAEQLMSDLVLEVAGVRYPAHRLILCASSEVFQVMLMNKEWCEWSESRILLQETPAASRVFPHFLKYFYTGQIGISYQTVLPVLSLADKYNVKDLVSLCLCYMSMHIAQAAKRGQLIAWMQYTMACGHLNVAKACQNFVKWNLEWACGDTGLEDLEEDTLVQLLQQSDLVIHNEMAVYDFVVKWLNKQKEKLARTGYSDMIIKANWENLVVAVFSHVRFPMMCPKQLANLLLRPLTQEYKDFFIDRMAIAMSYQSGKHERIAEIQKQGNDSDVMLFTPRLYTEDTWGSVLAVDNFHSLPCYHLRTFIFATRPTLANCTAQEKLSEWMVDLYPKGVWFKKSLLIVWAGTYDVPEVVLRTVRISITCQNPPESVVNYYGDIVRDEPDIRVKIGILVWGVQKGVEHVTTVLERVHRFSAQNKVLNIDDALDFDELNTPLYTPQDSPTQLPAEPISESRAHGRPSRSPRSPDNNKTGGRCVNCNNQCIVTHEPIYLLGPSGDQLRIQVVIVPLTDFSHVSPSESG